MSLHMHTRYHVHDFYIYIYIYMYVCIYIGSTLLDPAIGTVLPYPSTSINQELSQISLMSGVKKKRNVNLIRVYF